MLDYNKMRHNQERYEDFAREAEHDRLVRRAVRSRSVGERQVRRSAMFDSFRCHFAHFRYILMTRIGLRTAPAPC